MSTAVKKVAALLGVQNAFAGSSSTLSAFVPLELSPNSIRAACQEVGEQVLTQESQTAARSRDLRQQTATQRHTICPRCVYGSLDGFQAPLLEGWHELKAGVFWTVDEHGRALRPRYFVDTLPADAFANLVWTKAWEMGADLAEQLVFIADGSVWIWRIVQALFPHAVQILDWYHATTYLADIAAEAFGEGTPEAQTWLADQKAFLYDGHPAAVMHACRDLRPKAPATADVARRYFANNRTRLRYAKFRALGFQIGSGVMESACKQIGLQRLKLSGARWRQEGARLMAKARAAFLSQEINFHPDSLPQLA